VSTVVQKTVVQLVDDITGKEIPNGEGETIAFAFDNTNYTIDLDAKNAKKLRDTMAFYQDHAQKLGKSGTVPAMRRGKKNEQLDLNAVRAWASSNGYQVSSRGRVKGEIIDAFRAANA
jgi:hypothetical protein